MDLETLGISGPYEVIPKEDASKVVVRVSTSWWSDQNGLYSKKSLIYLKRQCKNYNFLREDVSNMSAEEVYTRIIDLDNVEDGIYEVITCNVSMDWEGGYIDDYDYKLVKI